VYSQTDVLILLCVVIRGDWVTREWRKIHNEELNDMYCSLNFIRGEQIENKMVGHVARMGARRGLYMVSVGKPEGKRPL
jgi:hypothetical protein